MKQTPHAEAEASLLRLHTEQLHDDADEDEDEDEDDEFGRSLALRSMACDGDVDAGVALLLAEDLWHSALENPHLHVLKRSAVRSRRKLPHGTGPAGGLACVGTGEGAEDAEGGSATSACCCCCCCCCRFMAERLSGRAAGALLLAASPVLVASSVAAPLGGGCGGPAVPSPK